MKKKLRINISSFADKKRVDLLAYYQPNTIYSGGSSMTNKSVDVRISAGDWRAAAANLFDPPTTSVGQRMIFQYEIILICLFWMISLTS